MNDWKTKLYKGFCLFWYMSATIQLVLAVIWALKGNLMVLVHLSLLVFSVVMIQWNRRELKNYRIQRACGGEG